MSKLARFCERHVDRAAIGVCVETGKAICAECSTQYQGVNYSKKGLDQFLLKQRLSATGARSIQGAWVLLLVLTPGALILAYWGFEFLGQAAVDLMQIQDNGGRG